MFSLVGACHYSHLKGLICGVFLSNGTGVGNSCCDKSRVSSKYRLLDILIPIGFIRHCSLSFLLYFIHSDTLRNFPLVCFTFSKKVNCCPLASSCPSRIYVLSTISILTTYNLPEHSLIYPAAPRQNVSAHRTQ